jgi:hypothetical protein
MGKSTPSAPTPPDPYQTADAQSQAFIKAAKEGSILNNLTQYTPTGSITYDRDAQGVPIAQRVSLTPGAQGVFNAQQALQGNLSNAAANLAGQVPTGAFGLPSNMPGITTGLDMTGAPNFVGGIDFSRLQDLATTGDFSADRDNYSRAMYDRGLSLLQPQMESERRATEQRLSNQGLPITGEAYEGEMNRLNSAQGDTLSRLAQDAVAQGAGEQSRLFGLSLSGRQQGVGEQLQNAQTQAAARAGITQEELANAGLADNARKTMINEAMTQYNAPIQAVTSLLGTTPNLNTPQGGNFYTQGVQAPNLEGNVYQSYNAQMQQYQAQQAQQNSMWSGIGSIVGSLGSLVMSDEDIKEDVGPANSILDRMEKIPIKSWRYKREAGIDDGQKHVGPMAQDFKGFFGLGNGKSIPTVDMHGVSMAAIQQLAKKVKKLEGARRRG